MKKTTLKKHQKMNRPANEPLSSRRARAGKKQVADLLLDTDTGEELVFESSTEDESPTATLKLSSTSAKLAIYTRPFETEAIRMLNTQYIEHDLDVQPKFQRRAVWDNKRKSRFIESVLFGFPIPLLFLAEYQNDSTRRYVIDGQQRLRALFEFIAGEFCLTGLGDESTYEGRSFVETGSNGKELLNKHLKTVTITAESNQDVAFDLFQRLNKGATMLNAQELRNCKYNQSAFNDVLIVVAKNERKFCKLMGFAATSTAVKRMLDVEAVLRFMAFQDRGYLDHPNKRSAKFLNDEMDGSAHLSKIEREKRRKRLHDAVDLCQTVFGERAFRRFHMGNAENRDGRWETRVNKSLADVQLYWFTRYTKGKIVDSADVIREKAIELMLNPDYNDLITHSASDKDRVRARFEKWGDMLKSIVDGTAVAPTFAYSVRVKLFRDDRTCRECKNQILLFDDAEVDHIKPISKGGLTVESNAALYTAFAIVKRATVLPVTRVKL